MKKIIVTFVFAIIIVPFCISQEELVNTAWETRDGIHQFYFFEDMFWEGSIHRDGYVGYKVFYLNNIIFFSKHRELIFSYEINGDILQLDQRYGGYPIFLKRKQIPDDIICKTKFHGMLCMENEEDSFRYYFYGNYYIIESSEGLISIIRISYDDKQLTIHWDIENENIEYELNDTILVLNIDGEKKYFYRE